MPLRRRSFHLAQIGTLKTPLTVLISCCANGAITVGVGANDDSVTELENTYEELYTSDVLVKLLSCTLNATLG